MFKNKTVFITGCNRGIGKNISYKFLENGANIICCVRKKDKKLENTFRKKKKFKSQSISFIEIDLSDYKNLKNVIKDNNIHKKKIDFLINNAAIAHGSIFEMTKIEKVKDVFEINFFSQLNLIQLLLRSLKKSDYPSIVNISSISGLISERGNIAYGTSKAALMFASKVLANELSNYNIRVNCIAPSIVDDGMSSMMTDLSKNLLQNNSYFKDKIPVEHISEIVLFLCTKSSQFINGTTIKVDGGTKL